MLTRFPKLKKTDDAYLLVNGQKQYFGPYTCSVTVDWNFDCKYEKGKNITKRIWNPLNPTGTDSTELPTWE
jgi:hypothetical protein